MLHQKKTLFGIQPWTLLVVLTVISLSGCSSGSAIFRKADTSKSSVFIDAKQRMILTAKAVGQDRLRPGLQRDYLACAEPSPDVFSTLASSVSGTGNYSDGDKAVLLQYARSVAESGVDIGLRTQTIQVLRDMMYRLCERYFNGAISTIQFEQQSARDQRLIISVLAIEQLTGAVRAPRSGISSRSSFERGKDLLKSQELLNDAIVKKNTAEKAFNALTEKSAPLIMQIATLTTEIDAATLDVAKEDAAISTLTTAAAASAAALKKKDDQYKAAKVISDKPNATPEQKSLTAQLLGEKVPLTAKSTADAAALKEANTRRTAAETKVTQTTQKRTEAQNTANEGATALSDAKKQFEDAQANVATAQSIRDAADSSANSSSGTVSFEPNPSSGSTLNKDTVTVLANAVTKIVDSTFDDDELARACLAFISRAASDEAATEEIGDGGVKNWPEQIESPNSFQLQNIGRAGSFEEYCAKYLEKQAERTVKLKQLQLVAEINQGKTGIPDSLMREILLNDF